MRNRIPHWLSLPKLPLLLFLLTGMEECGGCPLLTIKNFDNECHYNVRVVRNDFNYAPPLLAPGAEDLTILPEKGLYEFTVSSTNLCPCGMDEEKHPRIISEDGQVAGVLCRRINSRSEVFLDPVEITVENNDSDCEFTLRYLPPNVELFDLKPAGQWSFLLPTRTGEPNLLCATGRTFDSFRTCDCDRVDACAPDTDIQAAGNSAKHYFLTCEGGATKFCDSPDGICPDNP